MSNKGGTPDGRRSSRISLSLPIVIHGKDARQEAFRENSHTLVVNRHGAKFLTAHQLIVGSEILVENSALGSVAKANVVWISARRNAAGLLEAGVQLVESQNIWGLEFPPDDWSVEGKNKAATTGSEPTVFAGPQENHPVRARTAAQSSEQIATQILQDLQQTADAHMQLFTQRLEQAVGQIAVDMEVDLRTRANEAKEAELAALDHQIMASAERLAALKLEMEEVEARIELSLQSWAATMESVPPPLSSDQIHEKVQVEALPVLHLITESAIAAARERFQAQVRSDTSQAVTTWRDDMRAERDAVLEDAREQTASSVGSALESIDAQRDASLKEFNRQVQVQIDTHHQEAVAEIKSKLDAAAQGQSAALVEQFLATGREAGERQASLLQTQLDALLVNRLQEAQRHAQTLGTSLQNSLDEALRAMGEKNSRDLQARLREVGAEAIASSVDQLSKKLDESACASADKNVLEWQARLKAVSDQALASSSEQLHAQVADAVTVIVDRFLQQSEAKLHEITHETMAASSDQVRARIQESASSVTEQALQEWRTKLQQVADQAVQASSKQLQRQFVEETDLLGKKLQEMRDGAVKDALDAFRAQLAQIPGLIPAGGDK